MSNDPAAPEPDHAKRAEPDPREAAATWQLYGNRWPWITLDLILMSLVLSVLVRTHPHVLPAFVQIDGFAFWKERQWGQLAAAVFFHKDAFHLILNCYWIWLLGRVLEPVLKPLPFAGFVVAAALVTGTAELALSGNPAPGLTGIVYAMFGYMLAGRSTNPVFAAALPPLLTALFFLWVFAALLLHYLGASDIPNGAHFTGLAFGYGLGVTAWQTPRRLLTTAFLLSASLSFPLFWAPWQSTWLLAEASRAIEAGRREEGLQLVGRAVRHADNPRTQFYKGNVLYSAGSYAAARESFSAAAAVVPENPAVRNALAWLLATCPDPAVRNGTVAVEHAKAACEATNWRIGSVVDTYAAALAETGNFTEAVTWAEKAVELERNGKDRAELERHLAAFKENRPWRESAPRGDR